MSIPDAYLCIDNIQWTDFSFRTIMRYQIWSLYNSNGFGKNNNEVTDIMSLPWDNEKSHKVASDEELRQQKELMRQAQEMMKSGEIVEEKYVI